MAAIIVLALHLAIIAFNVAGCVLIPLGAWRGWRWVRGLGWRLAHLLSLAVVAIQAMLGRACFLTTWQGELSGSEHVQPMIEKWRAGFETQQQRAERRRAKAARRARRMAFVAEQLQHWRDARDLRALIGAARERLSAESLPKPKWLA